VLLFDLGGVIVELTGVPRMLEWTNERFTVEELWEAWLKSPSVRKFESGKSAPDEFAESMIEEFGLPVEKNQFLYEFERWPKRIYPGARELLQILRQKYTLASLSNNNIIHWTSFVEKTGLDKLFDYNFPSHRTGFLKPDTEAFTNAVKALEVKADEVLYLDDNIINVEASVQTGIRGAVTDGFSSLVEFLKNEKILK